MIDISVYDITEEMARYILAHWEVVGFFYTAGVLFLAGELITWIIKISNKIINYFKQKKGEKNDRHNL